MSKTELSALILCGVARGHNYFPMLNTNQPINKLVLRVRRDAFKFRGHLAHLAYDDRHE